MIDGNISYPGNKWIVDDARELFVTITGEMLLYKV
jgi:hypothetical protein